MNAIAWAIFTAAILMMPPRDKTDDGFHFNNWIDFLMLILGLGMMFYWCYKGQ